MADQITTTVRDLLNINKLRGFRLVAGERGLDREIRSCSILDYEFDPELKKRYHYTNFHAGMLVLTSFLYAKEKEYLITDAIRLLIDADVSALAIKNIYRLQIPNSALRYADSKGFPVFLIDDASLFIEPIISEVQEGIRLRENLHLHEALIERILRLPLNAEEETKRAYALCPTIGRHFWACYFYGEDALPEGCWGSIYDRLRAVRNIMCYRYRGRLLVIYSGDMSEYDAGYKEQPAFAAKLLGVIPPCTLGVSNPHHHARELREAIEESVWAAVTQPDGSCRFFSQLGSYQVLIGMRENKRAIAYSKSILEPIIDYDVRNGSQLQKTLLTLVAVAGNLHRLSAVLNQHENTLRQRLGKICSLTGLDFRKAADYEQLSIAVKLHQCQQWPL